MTVLITLCLVFSYGQDKKKATVEQQGKLTIVTYYHDNGTIQQTGSFNKKGELHGKWISYDTKGAKTSIANYEHGKKEGKWFFWKGNTLTEVDYVNSEIIEVKEWDEASSLAFNDKSGI
jgi:antitoxin component YwqK of YwqJK toxin-antitoxin module